MSESQPSPDALGRVPFAGSDRKVMLLSGLLLALSALLLATLDHYDSHQPGTWWLTVIIVVGFVLSERFAYHVEYRRGAVSFSMSDLPMALALVFLHPVAAVVIRVVTCTATIRVTWRLPAYKLIFNAALFAFDLTVAFWVVNVLTDSGTERLYFLLVVGVALASATFVATACVALAISFREGELLSRLANETRTALLLNPMVTVVACLAAAPALYRPELVVVGVVPVVIGWLVVHQYGELAQNYRDLKAVHGFSGLVGRSMQIDTVAETSVVETMRLLRAERGAIQIFDAAGEVLVSHVVDFEIPLPSSRHDPAWGHILRSDGVASVSIDASGRVSTDQRRSNCLVIPVEDADGRLGVLYVAGREGADMTARFTAADESRALTLGAQVAASVRRALLLATMEHGALHDQLTGEFNRRAFEAAVDERCAGGRTGSAAVFMLDLNRFKEVNDTLGHEVGDRVLIEFGRRLRRLLGPNDVLARFGSDEFAMLICRDDWEQIQDMADSILVGSFVPMNLDGLDVVVTASIGIAPVPPTGSTASETLRQADVAMYTAKRDRTAVETYRAEIDRRTPARLALLGSLRAALERDGIDVHYQPKVDLVTGTVIGAEALARWNHPTLGWVAPAEFIHVAEESGLIKQLTDQVLATAVQTVSEWNAAGHALTMAVNLSTHDLLDERLPKRIRSLLDEYGVAPQHLMLEVTESSLLADTPRTRNTINRLGELGVRMSLDDFGTGYSSLGYLRRLPVAELKVDQSFVKNLLLDEQDAVIVKSTIDLGHNLGLRVVAEGIENEPVLARLRELGCDIGQGFGISRPLAPDLFLAWLASTDYTVADETRQTWR